MVLPAWFAARVTLPTPVSVTMLLPDMLAGPLFTLSVTGRLELATGAVTANGALPYDLPPIAPNPVIV